MTPATRVKTFCAATDFANSVRLTCMLATVGHLLFRHRNAMFPLACLPLLLQGPEPFEDTVAATLLGVLIAGVGQLIRAMTIGLRYVIRGGRNQRVYAEDLVTDGIYAYIRNPMYVGNVLIVAGVAVAANSWATMALGIPLALFLYASIVAAEEQYLLSRFGAAFEAYCRQVPRWLPRFDSWPHLAASMQFRWRRVIVKEYGTPFGWINIIAGVTLYNFWHDGEWPMRQHEIATTLSVMVVTTSLWFIAWRLKRARILQPD